ncbi:hypothetical protein [Flaviaesturariibacter aridisoli]|uniref:Uncharacterized protein n=1 Tax=Flaviaesturariibacter aridisoli TaxID=2545761 RepID=A0A4R4DQK2_9BACT|nr:hypothetical protein [Flaviaesturariibacter aridisoli]TCZ64291.1 hypothetical protein E0486_18210 [Flaviaesturariibacter aridisoli]
MANNQPRIKIPGNVGEKIALGKKIFKKHGDDGADSPLRSIQDFNWDRMGPKMAPAAEWHDKAEFHRKEAEKAYRERDQLLGDIDGAITASRDVLKGVHKKNPKRLGDWGFEVDDTPKKKPGA